MHNAFVLLSLSFYGLFGINIFLAFINGNDFWDVIAKLGYAFLFLLIAILCHAIFNLQKEVATLKGKDK